MKCNGRVPGSSEAIEVSFDETIHSVEPLL